MLIHKRLVTVTARRTDAVTMTTLNQSSLCAH